LTLSAAQKATKSFGSTVKVHVCRVRFQRESLHQLSSIQEPANPGKDAKENPGHGETGAAEERRNQLKWSAVCRKHPQQAQGSTKLQQQLQRPGTRLERRVEITYNKKQI